MSEIVYLYKTDGGQSQVVARQQWEGPDKWNYENFLFAQDLIFL